MNVRACKRIIFTLLYDQGFFCITRNFRIQRVGDVNWLRANYGFATLAEAIDELIILDISRCRSADHNQRFIEDVRQVARVCFAPIAVGGGLRTLDDCKRVLSMVGDKVVLNHALFEFNDLLINEIAMLFGAQSIIGSIDYRNVNGSPTVFGNQGTRVSGNEFEDYLLKAASLPVGEIYLTCIDRDGTGIGLDLAIMDRLPSKIRQPIIISGGIGKKEQIVEGLLTDGIDAISTAHLLNFVGNGLSVARSVVRENGVILAEW